MPRELSYTDKALADLDAAKRWLTQPGSGPAARRRLAAIWTSIEGLRDHPCLHPVGQHPGVRELPCGGGDRALYRPTPAVTSLPATCGCCGCLAPVSPATASDCSPSNC